MPEEGKKILNRVHTKRKILVGLIWTTLLLGFAGIVMTIVAGSENFRTNYPFAETLQSASLIICAVSFVALFPLAIISVGMVRNLGRVTSDAVNLARLRAQQSGVPIPNVGLIADHNLLTFRSKVDRQLGSGPKAGINKIIRSLVAQGIAPDNPSFLELVRGSVKSAYRKTNDSGQAIVSFIIITSFMERLSLTQHKAYSTLDSLPANIRNFLFSVMNIQNAAKEARKIIYGK